MANQYQDLANKLFKNQEPAPVQSGNQYDEIAQKTFEPSKTNFDRSQFVAKKKDPSRVNEALKISRELNMPVDFVERNLESIKDRRQKTDMSYESIVQRSPRLAKWLEDPYKASVSEDDLETLSQVERNAGRIRPYKDGPSYASDLGEAVTTGYNNLENSAMLLSAAYGATDIDTVAHAVAERNARIRERQKKLPVYAQEFQKVMAEEGNDVDVAFKRFKGSFQKIKDRKIIDGLIDFGAGGGMTVAETLDQIYEGVKRPKGLFRSTLESLAFSAPSLVTGVVGAKVGAKAGALAGGAAGTFIPGAGTVAGAGVGAGAGGIAGFATGTFAGSAATEVGAWINQSLEERGFDTANPDDLVRAFRNKKLLAEIRGEAERKGVTTAGVDALFSVVAGKFLKGAGAGRLAKAKGAVKDIAVQSAGEGASEFAGQVAAREGDLSKVSLGEAVFEGMASMGHSVGEIGIKAGGELGTSFRSTLSQKTTVAAEEVVEQVHRAEDAINELQALEQLGDIAKKSNLQTKDAEAFAEFFAEANVDGGADQAVYFQKEQWDEYWQSKGESPVAKAEELLGGSYDQADQTGLPVSIPLKDYLAQMGDKPEFGELLQIARTQPDGMSIAEAKETLEQTPQVLEELAAEAKAEKELVDQAEIAGQEIKQRLEEQLVEAGRDKIEAVPLTAFYQTMGLKEGINPLELADRYGLNIRAVDRTQAQGSETVLDQDAKGRIRISGNNKFTIELLKGADKSTFFHESGHYFLEVTKDMASMENASPELKEDFQTILEWLGVDSADKISVEQHEKWARGFEAYLRDGKAPSSKLRKAFNTFKVWLTSVYRSLAQLNVELSPEIRDVMDRMLATQEEIDQARQGLGDLPLEIDPVLEGMSSKDYEAYQEANAEFMMAAKERLESKAIKVIDKRKSLEKQVNRPSVEKDISEQPLYQAIDLLQSSDKIDGAPPLKFDRKLFNQAYPEHKGNKKFRGMFAKDNTGAPLSLVANVLGFGSANDLIQQIALAPTKKEAIEIELQRRVDEMFAKEESSEALAAEADKALHNMGRAKMNRMRYEHLSKRLKNEATRRVVRGPIPDSQMRATAKKIINNMAVGTIRPNQYRLAQRRYRKEAGKLLAAKDIEGAFLAQERESLNHYLYKEAQDARDFVRKGEKRSKRFFEKDEKLSKSRDMDFIGAARAVLARYGLGNSKKDALAQIQKIKEYNPDAYETVSSIIVGLVDDPDVYTNIEFGRFKDLMDGVDSLWSLAKDLKEIEIDGKKIEIEKANQELASELDRFRKNKGDEKYNRTASKHEMRVNSLMGLKATFRRFEHWVDVMDLGKIDGPFRKYLFTPVSEATDRFIEVNKKFKERYRDLSKPIAEKIEYGKEIEASEINFAFKDKSELLGALLHTGNESNLRKLLVGRGWGLLDEDNNLVTAKWDQFIQRMWDEKVLTKEDYDYIQSVWDLMEDIKPMANKAHKKVFGYYFDEITAKAINTPFGNYRGGYAPAKVDPNAVTDIARKAELEEFIKGHQSYTYPASGGRGFTKSRVENFNKPLSLDMALVSKHISETLKFSVIKPSVVDVAKLIMSQEFKSSMGDIDSQVIEKMIKPALNRADKNSISNSDPSTDPLIMNFFNGLRTSAAMQIMFFNVTNTIEQIGGFGISATRINPTYLLKSTVKYMRSPKQAMKSITEKSTAMRTRTDDQIFEMEKRAKEIFSEESNFEKVKDWGRRNAYFTQALTQNLVDGITWQASYDESISQGKTEEQAIRKADADVRITQSSRRPIDVSNFETNQWVNFFNMFYSFFNMMANVNASNFTKLYYEDLSLKGKFMKGFYLYMMGFAAVAITSEAVKKAAAGGLDEDEDDEYLDDLYDVFVGSQINLGFAMIPIAGQSLNAGYHELVGGKAYETRLSASPAASVLATTLRTGSKLAKGELTDNKGQRAEIRDGLTALGLITGVPLAPLAKPINYARDVQSGKARPSGPIDAARGVLTGKPGVR